MPDVSVVIPNYHGGRLFREAVASVQAQTLTNWELVIVSDGCDDDLSDLERDDPRIRVFHQRNRGVSIARNVGIALANSALIALLDDDDIMLPRRLAAQFEVMGDEEVGLCHTQYSFIDENGSDIGAGAANDSQYRDFLRGDGGILISSVMFRKDLVSEIGGFSPLLPLSQDIDFLYRVAREYRLAFLPEVLAQYRRHSSNTWSDMALSGNEHKAVLRQHLFVAIARGESENVRAIRRGLKLVPTGRASEAIWRAHDARARHETSVMLRALFVALLFSPILTLRVSLKQARQDVRRRRRPSRRNGAIARAESSGAE